MSWLFRSEAALIEAAGETARRWRAGEVAPLIVGLGGDLGSGKTTWVRAMLRGLGYTGRVPSPTYTLVEHYPFDTLTVVHIDLYRLADDEELEHLGVRDWLDEPRIWLLGEWLERAESLRALADLELRLEIVDGESRRVRIRARTDAGKAAMRLVADFDSSYAR